MRILVVEDDPLISNALENSLKSSAYAVDSVYCYLTARIKI